MRVPTFMFPDQCTVEVFLGTSPYGEKFNPPYNTRGRLESKTTLIRKANGEEVTSTGTLFLPHNRTDVKSQSKITISGNKYVALEVKPVKGFRSVGYVEVLLG